jgi:hypothetical protein
MRKFSAAISLALIMASHVAQGSEQVVFSVEIQPVRQGLTDFFDSRPAVWSSPEGALKQPFTLTYTLDVTDITGT